MGSINEDFLEAYNRLLEICEPIYGGSDSVRSYLDEMNQLKSKAANKVADWRNCHLKLNELCKLGTQMNSGDAPIDSYKCHKEDIFWLKHFGTRIKKQEDPISLYKQKSYSTEEEELDFVEEIVEKPQVTEDTVEQNTSTDTGNKKTIYIMIGVGVVLIVVTLVALHLSGYFDLYK